MTDPTTIGRYKILNRLGHGGMGALFLAHDPAIDRMVAIKVMREGVDSPELRARFGREARAAGRLRHPNVVTIFDVGEDHGQPFIAMEYVPGETLEAIIQRRSRLPLARKLKLIEELCDGLAYAHKAGVVHRDIKPANLMLDSEGMLKILDFGIVRFAQSGMTQAGMLVGTLAYMSPEQVAGKPVDFRSDIFAVGDVAYELLSGKQAFPGNLQDGIMNRILHEAPKPLEQLVPGLDPEVARVVARALEKEPADRYQDLAKMRRDLARIRERLEEEESAEEESSADETVAAGMRRPPKPDSSAETAPPRPPTDAAGARAAGRREMEQRRQARIRQSLETAERALAAGDFQAAIAAADDAAILDPNNERAVEIIERAHAAAEDKQVHDWLEEAREHLNRGDATQAAALVEQARGLRPSSVDVRGVQQAVDEVRHELELARERAQVVREAVTRARADLAAGAFEMAIRAAAEALARQPQHTEALEIKDQASAALEQQRQREQHERAAAQAIESARRAFEAGQHEEAIEALQQFHPPHDEVSRTLDKLRQQALEIKRRREEEEREALRRKIAALTAAAQGAADAERYDEAIGLLERVRELDPASQATAAMLRKVLELRSAAEAAARIRAEIDQKLREAAAALERDDIGGAARFHTAALQLDPQSAPAASFQKVIEAKADALLSSARQASDSGRYEQAIEAATHVRALQSHASSAEAFIHETMQRKAAAEAAARTRVLVGEKVAAAAAALEQDDLRTAARLHQEARALDEASGEVARLGQGLQSKSEALLADARAAVDDARLDDALQLLERVRALEPRSRAAELLQQTIIERRAAEEAAARTRSLIEQHLAQASAALARGELGPAARLQEEASRLDPAHSAVNALAAEIMRRRGALEAHVVSTREAIRRRDFKAALDEVDRARAIDSESRVLGALAEQAASGLAEIEREEWRRKQIEIALTAATERLERGELDDALMRVNSALILDQASADALALRQRVQQAIDARAEEERLAAERRAEEERLAAERRAREARVARVLEKARKIRAHDQAIRMLRDALEIDAKDEGLLALLAERERAQESERVRAEEERREAERRALEARIAKTLEKARKSRSHSAALGILRDALAKEPGNAQLISAIREREAALEAETAARAASAAAAADAAASSAADAAHADGATSTVTWHGKWLVAIGGSLAAALVLYIGVSNLRNREAPRPPQVTTQAPSTGTGSAAGPPAPAPERRDPPAAEPTMPPAKPVEVPTTAATAPSSAESKEPKEDLGAALERQLEPIRVRARQELARGQFPEALATAQSGLKYKADDQALRSVLTDVASRASAETSQARSDAEKSGAPTNAAATYQQGLRQQSGAEGDRKAGRHALAARGLWGARDTFARAADEGKQFAANEAEGQRQQQLAEAKKRTIEVPPVKADPPAGSPTNAPVTAPPPAPPVSSPTGSAGRGESPAPGAGAKPAEPSPPRSSPVDETAAIERAIRAYEAAYNSRNIAAIRRVQILSDAEAKRLENTFREGEYKVTVQIQGIVPTAGEATVTGLRRIIFRSRFGTQDPGPVRTVFTLRKQGPTWMIVSVTGQ